MSTLSKTPDDKMHRYLQRIQKLVGHRAKSPILIKSRTKSPMNVKTSRIDSFLKHEMFFKSIISVWDQHHRIRKAQFFEKFIDIFQVKQTKKRDSYYSQQNYQKNQRKENDQPLAIRFMIKALNHSIYSLLRQIFQSIKIYQPEISPKKPQRTITKPLKHRRTYSEIYAESVSKYISKSPTTSQHYEFKTPSVHKKQSILNLKKVQTKLIASILQNINLRFNQNAFSELKSFYCKSLTSNMTQAKHYLAEIQEKFTALKNEQDKTNEQLKKANQAFLEQQKIQELTFSNLEKIKQQQSSKNQDQPNTQIVQLERVLHQTRGLLSILEILNRKSLFNMAFPFQKICRLKQFQAHKYAKCFALSKILKTLQSSRKKSFFKNLSQGTHEIKIHEKSQKSLMKTESRQVIAQRSFTKPQVSHQTAKIQSMQSSKHSHSSQKSNSSNFDFFAKRVNNAFELKKTLTQIYSFGFHKIDKASFVYMAISNPINKVLKTTLTGCFRKILFYSFYKSQQKQKLSILYEPQTIIKTHPIPKNYEQMAIILKKVERKILFMKIQAYSVLKLNSQLKKVSKIPEDFVISEIDLKKQIKEFLQQRNMMHQKTFDTWQKTKEMLQEVKQNQSRSSLGSRIKV